MSQQTITPEQWLAAVASVDDNPAVRAMARQTLDEFRALRAMRKRAVEVYREPLRNPHDITARGTAVRILGERPQP